MSSQQEAKQVNKTLVLENTEKRDALIAYEKKAQEKWRNAHAFEINAPSPIKIGESIDEIVSENPKFFGTMAYPYMNGILHAGHSFTLSKVEFQTGWERMQGKRALFPLGFHCTGMPIKACADKLIREIELFGENFDKNPDDEIESNSKSENVSDATQEMKNLKLDDVTKFGTKKSKAEAKKGNAKYQYQIMLQLGIPRSEVKSFANPQHWLEYFPPLCQKHCNELGARIDWRRSFITTDANPYYDSFIRWQMIRLKELNKIKFGERYTIYSPKDGQPCMDHDRQTGEGVKPQEYVAVKTKILHPANDLNQYISPDQKAFSLKPSDNVYLVAATLRPETIYGQTCCFVSPKINYGLYALDGKNDYIICTERAAKNMSYQKILPIRGESPALARIPGSALIGSRIQAPLAVHKEVYVLPMDTILEAKGTGIVICVPSDSPDDYITVTELAKKPEYYKINAEWVSKDIVPVIKTPTYGELTAQALVNSFKIQSPKDTALLAKAKEIAYKEGYYQGIMVAGPYKGEKVEVAKSKVRADLIKLNHAFIYNEPEGPVVSRSGDACVVALEDQWYLDYGEKEWKAEAEDCLAHMNTYGSETRHGFEATLDWLNNWACARSYGLGTHLPWDPQYLVESLSDSTIYMAYYTVAHYLHSDFYGQVVGKGNVKPEQMTPEVWDYIFCRVAAPPKNTSIPQDTLEIMKREFEYFYPVDVRVSGKDLVPNHLTFFIYNHVALFPKRFWPRGIRANGHLLLNNEKMSKSTGNFMTLHDMVQKFGADASRIALADAGDSVEDANFGEYTANSAILRLHTIREWCENAVKTSGELRTKAENETEKFFDDSFDAELETLVQQTRENYSGSFYKAALKSGWYDLQYARDYYREATGGNMRRDLVLKYIKLAALCMTPIAPHWADYLYCEVLGNKDLPAGIQDVQFPKESSSSASQMATLAALEYARGVARTAREVEGNNMKKQKKGKATTYDPKLPSKLTIYVADKFPEWQEKYIDLVRDAYNPSLPNKFENDLLKKVSEQASKSGKLQVEKQGSGNAKSISANILKKAMPFVQHLKYRIVTVGESTDLVFNRNLLFDEKKTLLSILPVLQKVVSSVKEVQIILVSEGKSTGTDLITGDQVEVPNSREVEGAVPGNPGIVLANIKN